MGVSTVTFGDVYTKFNYLIGSTSSIDVAKKVDACNEGYLDLVRRMAMAGKGFEELITGPTDMSWTISTHKIELPSDYVYLHSLFQADGSNHRLVDRDRIISFDRLIWQADENFNNTSDTGDFFYCAIAEPYLYLDKYATATDADGVKIVYYKKPTLLEDYIKLAISSVSGTFTAGSVVTGASSGATGTIRTGGVASDNLLLGSVSGVFTSGESISQSGGVTATAGATTDKPQTLDTNVKASLLLAVAFASVYMKYRRHDAKAADYSKDLDSMIKEYGYVQAPGRMRVGVR